MKITILGAGAIGCHLAARMARANIKFTLVARPAAAEEISRNGLRFVSQAEDYTVPVTVAENVDDLGEQDAVIVALKSYSLTAAIDDIVSMLGPNTIVVFATNGIPWWYGLGGPMPFGALEKLDPQGQLATRIGVAQTVGCVVHSANALVAPATVRNISKWNRFVLGLPSSAVNQPLEALSTVLSKAVDEISVTNDIRTEIWKKLLHNLPSSLIGSLTLTRADQIANNQSLASLYTDIRNEGRLVAASVGVDLPDDLGTYLKHMANLPHRSSFQQDLIAGRKLEIDSQISAVVEIAHRTNVNIPTTELLANLLTALVNNRSSPN